MRPTNTTSRLSTGNGHLPSALVTSLAFRSPPHTPPPPFPGLAELWLPFSSKSHLEQTIINILFGIKDSILTGSHHSPFDCSTIDASCQWHMYISSWQSTSCLHLSSLVRLPGIEQPASSCICMPVRSGPHLASPSNCHGLSLEIAGWPSSISMLVDLAALVKFLEATEDSS